FQSGEATYSERFKVVFQNQILGTNDIALDAVSVYPNPAQNVLYVVSPNSAIVNTAVYDIQGRKVLTTKNTNDSTVEVPVSTLSNALYFVEITTEAGVVTKRIIKE
ncbi:T9SS type A sorting domain-containing protein, partial [Ulvibacter litoralis]